MKRDVFAVALITLIVLATPLRAEVPFDGEGTWVKMRPVAELKILIEAAERTEKRSSGHAQGVRRLAPTRLQAKGK